MTQEKKSFQPILPENVFHIYVLLSREGHISFPLTEQGRNGIETIVASITGKFYEHELYSSNEEKALAYLYFIIKDHPFIDGNKRTASLVFQTACDANRLLPKLVPPNPTLDELAVFIEQIQERDHHKVIKDIAKDIFGI